MQRFDKLALRLVIVAYHLDLPRRDVKSNVDYARSGQPERRLFVFRVAAEDVNQQEDQIEVQPSTFMPHPANTFVIGQIA